MNWTNELPTKDGWYWWRQSQHHKPEIEQVFRGEVWEDRGAVRTPISSWAGQWAGPLEAPE